MMKLRLIQSSMEYKEQITEMMDEWSPSREDPFAIWVHDYHDFENYCARLNITDPLVPGFVTDTTFFCLDEERDKVVGIVNNDEEMELNNLSVLPQMRHQGIGQKMLTHCAEQVRLMGRSKIKIGIVEENQVLRKWYEQNGFIHTGTEKFDFFPFTCGYMERRIED